MEPIKATYQETEDFYLKASEEIPSRRINLLLLLPVIVIALLTPMLYLTGDRQWYLPGLVCCVFLFLLFSKWSRRRAARQSYRRACGNKNVFVHWEFDADYLCCKAGYDVATRYNWNWPQKITQKPGGFLIRAPNKLYHWVPRSAFASEQEFQRLAELMKSKVKDFEVKEGG